MTLKKKELTYIAKKKFGKIFHDPSNKNKKFLRTNIRDLKINLVSKGLEIEKIIKSIKNIASTKQAIDFYVHETIRKIVNFRKKMTIINLEKLKKQPSEIKFRIINIIVKKRSNSYYPPRSKKVINLIDGLQRNRIKKCTLGGCIFERKKNLLFVSKELSNIAN